MVVSNTENKRKWDKKFFCVYCKTMQAKLPRHLERKHASEIEVAQILSLAKNTAERKDKISALRALGLFQHNTGVFKTGAGVLIPKRRPKEPTTPTKYLPCEKCGEFYVKKQLARHQLKCKKMANAGKPCGRDRSVQARSALLIPTGKNASTRFKCLIMSKMTHDGVFQEIATDKLIQTFGESLLEKLGHEERHHRMISNRCRELGRFMLEVKKIDSGVKTLTELITPSKYQTVKKGVQNVAGFDFETNTFKTPSLALKLGQSLKKCACVLKGSFMEDNILRHSVDDINSFLELVELKWTTEMASKAHRTLEERKWNAPRRLPLAKDIVVLNKFLLKEDARLCSQIIKQPSVNTFEQLTEVALCRTLVLNCRRVGEVQYMHLKDYKETTHIDEDSDIFKSLSDSEKALTKKLRRIEIRGKKGRKVPVILTEDMQSTINLLVEKREECGVSNSNKYLFPSLRHESGHYRAHVVLRKMAVASGAQNPSSLTSTKLRKHVATMTQLLNLRTHELDALATFMGHDIRVHRQYYRLQDDAMELAKVSKLLINLDKGKLSLMKNRNLDELVVASDESLSEDEEIDDLEKDEMPINSVGNDITSFPSTSALTGHATEKFFKNSSAESVKKSVTMKSKRRHVKPRPWSQDELVNVRQFFRGFIHLKKVPRKEDVQKFLEKHGAQLHQRSWSDVKWCVKNSFSKILE
ncbi:uncharacterized protein LOC134533339 isoform X1 [Bacillus rossius redtenbacheri]|uniref:uncharacterized protein LOC134533339 isoform X1 n=1 Tax=Bacillus rossius redtenbacheri TaxID=93214 RepID=UPI002FDEC37F